MKVEVKVKGIFLNQSTMTTISKVLLSSNKFHKPNQIIKKKQPSSKFLIAVIKLKDRRM